MRVAITAVQVPYISGGAEAHARGLRDAIATRGHVAELVTAPFRFGPPSEVSRAMRFWEAEDFTLLAVPPDRVICLTFPSYALRHPAKCLWLLHQHRSAYELYDTAHASAAESALKDEIAGFDSKHIGSIARRFANSKRVSERLKQFNGIDSQPLYHPPPFASRHFSAEAQPYVFFPSRFETAKRQELVIRAMRHVRASASAVFAGEGGQMERMRDLAAELGLNDRVRFLGRVSSEELIALYAHATAVCFTPFDEDYGYITIEAMLSSKPVITCTDSGGPLEFVIDGETGRVTRPDEREIAAAIDDLFSRPTVASQMGKAGRALCERVVPDWDHVVDALLA